jgi:diguanylate cyclase (GGDEF)-like protein
MSLRQIQFLILTTVQLGLGVGLVSSLGPRPSGIGLISAQLSLVLVGLSLLVPIRNRSTLSTRLTALLTQIVTAIATFGFVWECSRQWVRLGIPIVVNDPPRMSGIALAYAGWIGLGVYLWSRIKPHSEEPTPAQEPMPSAQENHPQEVSVPDQGFIVAPVAGGGSFSPGPPEPSSEMMSVTKTPDPVSHKTVLTTLEIQAINGPNTGDRPYVVSLNRAKLKQIQDSFAALTGLSLLSYTPQGEPLLEPSRDNPICKLVQSTQKGQQHCQNHCGRSVAQAHQSTEPVFFSCEAGLHVFALPVTAGKQTQAVLLGGKTFVSDEEAARYPQAVQAITGGLLGTEGTAQLPPPPSMNSQQLLAAARFVELSAPYLLDTLVETEMASQKLSRLLTLWGLTTELRQSTSFHQVFQLSLSSLGVLLNLHTAAFLVRDRRVAGFRVEEGFGPLAPQLTGMEIPPDQGIMTELIENGRPVSTQATFELLKIGLPSEVNRVDLFPLTLHGQVSALLAVFNTPLSEEDHEIITSFCQPLSLVLENHLLGRDRQALNQDLSVFLEIAKAVGTALDSEELFPIVLEKSTEFLRAEQGSLLLLDDERHELCVKAIKGLNRKIVERLRIRPGEGISGRVLASGSPLIVADLESDDRIRQEKRPRYKTKSFISIPLKLNGRTIGVLNVADKITGEMFSDDDLRLLISIGTYASVAIERSQLYHKTEELKKISITDPLTGLLNRRYFQERMAEEIERSRRHHLPLSLIMLDIDNFKKLNDTYGHLSGDEVLKMTSRCLRTCIRTIDVAARYGGEEFTVILPQTAKADAITIAERICTEVNRMDFPFETGDRRMELSVSVGLASLPEDAETLDELIRNSDIALYTAKSQGKNRVVVYKRQTES